jgi:ectoine hydroxylase-related dioxygenase (phytanoyl-CoA dioxygenase family)
MNSEKRTLTQAEVDKYNQDGYVLPGLPMFDDTKFNRLRDIFEENLERYGEEDLDVIHFKDARLLEFLLSDEVLDMIEPVVGPNIGLWSSHFISKAPRVGKATPWHEDSSYWKGRVSTMEGICTVWLALDEATPENGCMRVIPGTHKNGFSEYEDVDPTKNLFGTQIKPDQINESQSVYFSLKPNEFSLHEGRIIHGAEANTSNARRAGYTMRYFPTTSEVYEFQSSWHKIWLARGKDMAGNKYENA